MRRVSGISSAIAIALWATVASDAARAQGALSQPPSGDNQKAEVKQWIGLVEVGIAYSSPDVTGPNGEDRKGHIWGELVPYGMANLGFGACGDQCPWRAGANEGTVFRVSHDVTIEGKPLAAGVYGLHMVPGKDEWTVVFSKDSTSWGSFFYRVEDDALRVAVKPRANAYNHFLTYEFSDRRPDRATVELRWEELAVPFTVAVPNVPDVYIAAMRRDLKTSPGFDWRSWSTAAQYCVDNNTHLEEAESWAQAAISASFVGQENFTTLATLAAVQQARAKGAEASATLDRAIAHPTADAVSVHTLARGLQQKGAKSDAIRLFKANAKKFPNVWPVNVGLARALSAEGKYKEALVAARAALAQAPDPGNKQNVERLIGLLAQGKDIN